MGLLRDADDNYVVLSDILGSEDAHGLMDFKITGNERGILSFQMDIKAKNGLPREVLSTALDAACKGRLHILGEMSKVISSPRSDVATNAPRVISMKIDKDKIGALIGPGGKTIRDICSTTDTTIDVGDEGIVKIFSKSGDSADKAKAMVKAVTGDIDVGTEYDGIVRSIVDFGVFVQILPGKDGLVHVSAIARDKQSQLNDLLPIGSTLKVVVTAADKKTGRIRLVAPSLEG
jgi:polyribonucleotide nucleotidyltransferase